MKKNMLILSCFALMLFSCGEKKADAPVAEAPTTLPMEVTYTGKPVLGSWDNVKTVMEWNKRLSEMNTDLGDLLADSVTLHLADGMEFNTTRDSIVHAVKGYIAQMTNVKVVYTAAVPVNNVDKNHEWVFSWTRETYTYKDGKVQNAIIHEDYRLEGGKIREVFQYERKEPTKK